MCKRYNFRLFIKVLFLIQKGGIDEMNKIIMTGRLVATPQLKKVGNSYSVVSEKIATSRYGAKGEETYFVPINVWGKSAEYLASYAHKGDLISVVGYLKTSTYEKEGQTHFKMEVQAEQVEILSKSAKKTSDATNSSSDVEVEMLDGVSTEIPC